MFQKQNRDGKIKGQTVSGGNKQSDYIPKEDSISPTISIESVILSCIIYAKEERDVTVIDISNDLIQTRIEHEKDMATINIHGILVGMLLDITPYVLVFCKVILIDYYNIICLCPVCNYGQEENQTTN